MKQKTLASLASLLLFCPPIGSQNCGNPAGCAAANACNYGGLGNNIAVMSTANTAWVQFTHTTHWSSGPGCSTSAPGYCQPTYKTMYEGALTRTNRQYIGLRVMTDDTHCITGNGTPTGAGQGGVGGCYAVLPLNELRIEFQIANYGTTVGYVGPADLTVEVGPPGSTTPVIVSPQGTFSVNLPVQNQCLDVVTDVGTTLWFETTGDVDTPSPGTFEILELTITGAWHETTPQEQQLNIGWNDTFVLYIEDNGA